jgi:hypothetical protein
LSLSKLVSKLGYRCWMSEHFDSPFALSLPKGRTGSVQASLTRASCFDPLRQRLRGEYERLHP